MKSVIISAIEPTVDIYGSPDANNLNLLISGYTGTTFTVTGITDETQFYTVRINKINCDPLIKTFTFSVTPTPTPTYTPTPTPTITPAISITWAATGSTCETQVSCQSGYTLSSDGSYCYGYLTAIPTSGTTLTVNNRRHVAYSNFGAKLYEVGGYDSTGDVTGGHSTISLAATPLWANPSVNTTDGRLNAVGVWGVTGICASNNFVPIANEYIGFTATVYTPTTKIYYIGIAGDNQVRFKINGYTIVQQSDINDQDHFKYWHIYPVYLQEGYNFIEIAGKDDGSVSASFGAEVYDNTLSELSGATIEADLNILFSTKDYFCDHITAGSSYGYQCPAGYTLDMTGSPVCKKRDEVEPFQINTGYKTYQYRIRLVNGVPDGYIEPNSPSSGIGPYFPPVFDLSTCPVGSIDPTPTVTPTISLTPSVTPTISLTPSPTPSTNIGGCLIYTVDSEVESLSLTTDGTTLTFNILGMESGYYGAGNIAHSFFISSTNCRPCSVSSGSVQFIRRGDVYYEIMNFYVYPNGQVNFEGYLPPGYIYDAYFTTPTYCTGEGCILKGSLITLADGSQKPIENLKINDLLMSINIDGLAEENYKNWITNNINMSPSLTTVKNVRRYAANKMFKINDVLISTFEHRHFIKRGNNYLFETAENIGAEDYLLHHTGEYIKVNKKEILTGYFETYNLDVEDIDVFFANGLLTHNKELP